MPDKAWKKLNEIDVMLRKAYPTGMREGLDITIEKRTGFELFNTRPYHNYETWSDGYWAYDDKFQVKSEDLDDCIKRICELRYGATPHAWEFVRQEDREAHMAWVKEQRDAGNKDVWI
jgi:hypothetical protein